MELAICLPFLILLVCGLMDVGLMIHNKEVITNASREGARAGITGMNDDEIKNIVLTYCNREEEDLKDNRLIDLNLPSPSRYELKETEVTVSGPDAENDLTVRVNYNYVFWLGNILGFTNKPLSAQTIMRME